MAYCLVVEIEALAKEFGIEHLGFLTLTFKENLVDIREAQRRFNSLNTNVIRGRYRRAIGVWERQERGAVHFHLVVVLNSDIRSGFDFKAVERGDYRSACPALRAEWAFWRETAPAYRFGRTELLPVKSTGEGIAKYVGKYVQKHVWSREKEDKGARVVRFIGFKSGDRKASSRFAWVSPDARVWRRKVARFAKSVGAETVDDLRDLFGPQWCYVCQQAILDIDLWEETPARPECVTDQPSWNVPETGWEPVQCKPGEWTADKLDASDEMRLYAVRSNGFRALDAVINVSRTHAKLVGHV